MNHARAYAIDLPCVPFHDLSQGSQQTGECVSVECSDLELGRSQISANNGTDSRSSRFQPQQR